VGAALPLIVTALAPQQWVAVSIAVTALISLAILGGLAARVGGAKVGPGVLRVTFWSALSMGVASAVGAVFGAT
ncbi:VIT family protein, partial [Paraburkholderia strydomiana]